MMEYKQAKLEFVKIRPIGNGEGLNSQMFLAQDIQMNAELAVKQIEIAKFKNADEYFLEAKMLYDNQHPNIMEIQYASRDEQYIYLSMPYHEKGSLNSLINDRYLTTREIIKYSLDLLSGVAYIHSKNLIHLDIKPTNILLHQSNRAILTDFGLSKYLDENGIAEQIDNYIPHIDPEYFLNTGRTVLSDIYQIGLTLYRLCNGNILKGQLSQLNVISEKGLSPEKFKEVTLNGKYPDREYFLPHIPQKLRKIIQKCLEVKAEKRYNNVIQIMNDLSDIDENLDWCLTGDSNELYRLYKENAKISISVKEEAHDKIRITCYKTNILSGNITKMKSFCSLQNSQSSTMDEIARIIKENN